METDVNAIAVEFWRIVDVSYTFEEYHHMIFRTKRLISLYEW